VVAGDLNRRKSAYDFVIVGSGYGGAIAAARLAAAHVTAKPSVCVFERGKEWPVGSFPDSFENYMAETRSSANPLGLYETLHDRDISVIKGNGLEERR
jgi:cholesterol oxidase